MYFNSMKANIHLFTNWKIKIVATRKNKVYLWFFLEQIKIWTRFFCVRVMSHIAVSFAKESRGCGGPAYLTVARFITAEFWMLDTFWRILECQILTDSFTLWLLCLWVYDSLTGVLGVHLIILCRSLYWITLITILLHMHSSSKLKLPHYILSFLLRLLAPGSFVLFPTNSL